MIVKKNTSILYYNQIIIIRYINGRKLSLLPIVATVTFFYVSEIYFLIIK